MVRKPKVWPPEYGVPDDESPEWTVEDFRNARPVREVMPELIEAAERLRKRLGRPKLERPKEHVSLRLDPVVVDSFKEDGPGWRTRINDELVKLVKRRKPAPAKKKKKR
ncbi:MAG TPA: BrnA antitoxin family protein [Rhizomicrobium sp.]